MREDERSHESESDEEVSVAPRVGTEGTSEEEAPPAPRPSRRRLRMRKAEELGTWDFFEAHDPAEPVEVVMRSERIGNEAGDVEVIGSMLQRLGRLLRTLGGDDALMEDLAFGQSVSVYLRASDEEIVRARAELRRAGEIRRAAPERQEAIEASLERAVTSVQLGVALAADLLEATPDRAPEAAVAFGSEVAEAYRSLATRSAREEVTVVVSSPDRDDPVTLTPQRAERVAEALREVTEPRTRQITVFGVLQVADAIQHGFALRLDPRRERDPLLRGKRIIRGTYTPRAGDMIRDLGLWGKGVRAQIEVERDALVSTSTIRPASYTLLEVEEAAA